MTIPDYLTMSRLGLAFILIALLSVVFPFAKTLALLVFIVAGITDYLDGHLARTRYGTSAFGRLMDPLTDKVLVSAAFVSLVGLRVVPAWIVVIIISREFLVTGLRLLAANKGEVISAGKWGKHKTVWQIVAISTLLLGLSIRDDLLRTATQAAKDNFNFAFGYIALGISLAAAAITLASGWMYATEHRDLIARGRS